MNTMEQPYIIGIRFQKGGKIYHFDASQSRDLQPNDYVVVETARGRQLGEVIEIIATPKPHDGSVKPIQRKATPRDLVLRQIWQCKEAEAIVNCRTKAKELGLADLKFVGAEFSFDGTRLTLMYNSEEGGERPDLRSLRRAMGRFYPHAQIEMHPMGPRDVAKLLGGMGACGLEERCCTAYLADFSPISIKMAKEQGISLTPTEITGMCGRLRCCLAYEFEQYTEARKLLPKRNKRVLTPQGEGRVLEVLPLKGAVLVMLENEVIHEYLAHEIQLFDDNGVAIPRVKELVDEETVEEAIADHSNEYEQPGSLLTEAKFPDSDKEDRQPSPPHVPQPSQRKPYQGRPRQDQHTGSPEQKHPQTGGSAPGTSKKQKPGQRHGVNQGDSRQTTGNRPMRGKHNPGQRRERGR
jgi:cell fate regulator YaaT (PSP1 superfamily)